MENVNEYTKLMGEWIESSIDTEVIESVEETYNLLKASRAIAESVLQKEKPYNNGVILDVYNLIIETKNRNFPLGEDIYIDESLLIARESIPEGEQDAENQEENT